MLVEIIATRSFDATIIALVMLVGAGLGVLDYLLAPTDVRKSRFPTAVFFGWVCIGLFGIGMITAVATDRQIPISVASFGFLAMFVLLIFDIMVYRNIYDGNPTPLGKWLLDAVRTLRNR